MVVSLLRLNYDDTKIFQDINAYVSNAHKIILITNLILYFTVQNSIILTSLNAACGSDASDTEKIKCLFTSTLLLKTEHVYY